MGETRREARREEKFRYEHVKERDHSKTES
jgi:hypothetical protein